jgi:hypothetical protein
VLVVIEMQIVTGEHDLSAACARLPVRARDGRGSDLLVRRTVPASVRRATLRGASGQLFEVNSALDTLADRHDRLLPRSGAEVHCGPQNFQDRGETRLEGGVYVEIVNFRRKITPLLFGRSRMIH